MQDYKPSQIIIDPEVLHSEVTQRILGHFPSVPQLLLNEKIKKEEDISEAKKKLFLSSFKGEIVKSCQGLGDYVCCDYMTMTLVSNCHLECSYCILQDYLKNNPLITIYTNINEILEKVERQLKSQPNKKLRIGTGELSDSLALDNITEFSKELVPFTARQNNLILELKTKSNQIQNLLDLDHQGKTVISWSMNPPLFSEWEEHKCASIEERIQAALAVSHAGYPIAFHLDPLLALDNWKEEYENLIIRLKKNFANRHVAWISMGSLRFTPGLKKTMKDRFPKSKLHYQELYPNADGKVRYFRDIREDLYKTVKAYLEKYFPGTAHYLCMETETVWGKVFNEIPESKESLEKQMHTSFLC